MSKIALTETTFSLVPEGTHVFRIESVTYKEDFGKLEILMKTAQGGTHTERFSFVNAQGQPNEVALGIFSFFAKTALQNWDLTEIDHTDLVGKYIKCEVTHEQVPNKKDPAKTMTFSRLGNKYPANGFEDDPTTKPATATPTIKKAPVTPTGTAKKVDLASILGRK